MARWTDSRKAQAAELYQQGLSLKEIADRLGSNPFRVANVLRKAGVQILSGVGRFDRYRDRYEAGLAKRPKVKPWAWTPERHAQVAHMHAAGLLQKEIAASLYTSQRRVCASLKLQGIASTRHGRRNPAWKGGKILDKHGYVLVSASTRKHANSSATLKPRNGYVREHRLVMEEAIGRRLRLGEVVHHINGKKDDNRLENLEVYASNGDHLRVDLHGRCPNWSKDGKARILAAAKKTRPKARRTHCPHGHEYTANNTYFRKKGRVCRTCVLTKNAEKRRFAGARELGSNLGKTRCPQWHLYSEENTYRPPGRNARVCRRCLRERAAARRRKNNT